ncbi:MAG: aminoglycoside phosphotransferase family protein [Asgard group archaeon]|nr:aminoglycoside phosphotransferase family protein [Asgard group archaeon]
MVFYEAVNPADISAEEILPIIRKFLPRVQLDSIRFFYHGTYNVFEINQEYIVRVADREFRNANGIRMLQREKEILQFLRDKIPVVIPDILFLNDSNDIPLSIHKKIPGKSLTFIIQQFSKEQKEKIGMKVGKFLSVFHSKELMMDYFDTFPKQKKKFVSNSNFIQKFKSFWKKRYKKVKDIAFQYLDQKQQDWLLDIFDDYLDNDDNFTFTPRISHCDFDTSNILVNPDSRQLTGIIDFEECKIWDPVVDLLFFDEGIEFLSAVLKNYSYSNQKGFQTRMKFYFCRTCVPYLIWGTVHNQSGMIDEGMRRIKKNMKMFP